MQVEQFMLEFKDIILEIRNTQRLLMPNEFELAYLANQVNISRQSMRDYLIRNYEPEKEYFKKGGKIMVSKETAVSILRKYDAKRQLHSTQ